MTKIKSDVILKKGPHGWEAWQTNKLIAKVPGFSEESKEEVMKYIPGYENVIESSKQPIISDMAMKQIEKYYKQGILNKREVIAVLMKENGWSLTEAEQIADYYEKLFNSRQIKSSFDDEDMDDFYGFDKVVDELCEMYADKHEVSYTDVEKYLKEKGFPDWAIEPAFEEFARKRFSRQIRSRFYQNGEERFYSLSECAQYLSSLFFDLRTIHFLTTGSEFYTYHELAQELYEKTEDYYDDIVETAIGYDSNIQPMYVLPGDWNFVDENGSLSTDGQIPQTLILERLERIYDVLENVQEYDSMVSSKLDGMKEFYDKEIYKLSQALK